MKDFDLLIQGPINTCSLDSVFEISDQFSKIVISTWMNNETGYNSDDFVSYLKSLNFQMPDNCHISANALPDISRTRGVLKDSTFFYALESTLNGLRHIESKYVIKMRTDEKYSDFSCLKNKFLADDEKMVCGNIFFKPWNVRPYHIGDHLFAAKTSYLISAYEYLLSFYTGKEEIVDDEWYIQGGNKGTFIAENILAKSFLKCKNVNRKLWSNKQTFVDNFDLVNISEMGEYFASWQHGGKSFDSKSNPFIPKNYGCISNMSEV